MQRPFSFEFDPKIERVFRSRRKKLKLEEQIAKVRETSSTMTGSGDEQGRTLRDFITLGVQGITSSIARPNVEATTSSLSRL